MVTFTGLTPMLQTHDLPGSIAWYEDVLGFSVAGRMDDTWCHLQRDGVSIMFMNHPQLGKPKATATQYFYVDDVDALWNEIKDRCTAEWGPEDMPYGMREVAVKDPNGYILSFGMDAD